MNIVKIFERPSKVMTLRDYKSSVEDDINMGLPVKILKATRKSLVVEDLTEYDRILEITNPELIDKEWIKQKIVVTPGANSLGYNLDVDEIASYLASNVKRNYMVTLDGIVFCDGSNKDWEYLHSLNDEYKRQAEVNAFPNHKVIGIFWYDSSKVLVNVEAIVKSTNLMIKNGELEEWEKEDVINEGLMMTLLHEIRHLAQANPYLPEEILNQEYEDNEIDAEEYAKEIYSKCKVYAMLERDKDCLPYIEDVELQ